MNGIKSEVTNALKVLGCKGRFSFRTSDMLIVMVYKDGSYWGRYDMSKHTFVD